MSGLKLKGFKSGSQGYTTKLVMLALVVGLELIQPPVPLTLDPQARNSVPSNQVQFNGLPPIFANRDAVRAAFGEPDRVYTDINDYTGNSEDWVFGHSEVSFHEDDGDFGSFRIKDARYPVRIGTLTLRVGESAAPLATAFPISWRNRRPIEMRFGPSLNDYMVIGMTDSDLSFVLVEVDGDGRIVSIASGVDRV